MAVDSSSAAPMAASRVQNEEERSVLEEESENEEDAQREEHEASSEDTVEVSTEAGTPSVEANDAVAPTPQPCPQQVPRRPSLYSQTSISMINLPPQGSEDTADGMLAKPKLETVKSGEQLPFRISLPPQQVPSMPNVILSPAEWARPPPTPAAGLNGFNFSVAGKDKQKELKRRRSADDLVAPPPKYEPPFPGTFVPKPRDEEGREKLPNYWCSVRSTCCFCTQGMRCLYVARFISKVCCNGKWSSPEKRTWEPDLMARRGLRKSKLETEVGNDIISFCTELRS